MGLRRGYREFAHNQQPVTLTFTSQTGNASPVINGAKESSTHEPEISGACRPTAVLRSIKESWISQASRHARRGDQGRRIESLRGLGWCRTTPESCPHCRISPSGVLRHSTSTVPSARKAISTSSSPARSWHRSMVPAFHSNGPLSSSPTSVRKSCFHVKTMGKETPRRSDRRMLVVVASGEDHELRVDGLNETGRAPIVRPMM